MATTVFYPQTEAELKYHIPDIIYHYTSTEGLMGIVTNNELWFSKFDCLNDMDEGKYILNPYRKATDGLNREIDNSFLRAIVDLKPDY